jgi:hypothetical protein
MADMTSKISKTKNKRLPKGQRTYIRRMKQTARRDVTVYRSLKARHAPVKIADEQGGAAK